MHLSKKYNPTDFFYDTSFDEYDIKNYLLFDEDFLGDIINNLSFVDIYNKNGYVYIFKKLEDSDIEIPIGKFYPVIDDFGMHGKVEISTLCSTVPHKLEIQGYYNIDYDTKLYSEIIVSKLIFKYV